MNDKNSSSLEKNNDLVVLDVKDVVKVFNKRKWLFIGSFIIVLIISLLFSFYINKNSQYGVKSQFTISLNNIDTQSKVYALYPEDSDKLWLISNTNWWSAAPNYLKIVKSEIRSESVIKELNKSLGLKLSNNELLKLIRVDVVIVANEESTLVLTTYFNDAETAKKINEKLIDIYTTEKISEFNITYNELLLKIEKQISDDQLEIQKLSKEAEDYIYNTNKKLLEDISKSTSSNKIINFSSSSFIPPELQNKINVITGEYNTLLYIKKNLTENKSIYINRISIQNLSDVDKNSYTLRDILISLFASLLAGIIMVYIVNFIYILRKK